MSVKVNVGYHPHNVIWKIKMIENVRQYESNVFVLEKAEWRLRMLIDKNVLATENTWKIFLRKLHPRETYESFVISIYAENKKGKLECLATLRSVYARVGEDVIMWRYGSYIGSRHPDIVLKGTLTLVFMFLPDHNFDSDLENYTEDKRIQTPPFMNLQPCLERLSMDFEKLLEREDEMDVELHCRDGKTLKAHKGVLISRSDVFSAMLQYDTVEKSRGAIKIDDVDFETMEHFLRYLYTGSLPELNLELASSLYEVGDKYAVLSLRDRCANFLRESLSDENAGSLLILSETRNDKELKECVLTYIVRNDLVMSVCEESTLRDSHPKLGFDVLFRAYKLTRRSYK